MPPHAMAAVNSDPGATGAIAAHTAPKDWKSSAATRPGSTRAAFVEEWSRMSAYRVEADLSARHGNGPLRSFGTSRDLSFRFKNGQSTIIGLEAGASVPRPAGTELALRTTSVSMRPAALFEKSANAVKTRQRKLSPLPFRLPAEVVSGLPFPPMPWLWSML